jgi:creatinine amidohydrolase
VTDSPRPKAEVERTSRDGRAARTGEGDGFTLADLTTEALAEFLDKARSRGGAVALIPIGSTEPHGPHLPLSTDILLSEEACRRAVRALAAEGRPALVAPPIGYGVTRYAAGFRGAIGVSDATLVALVSDVARALLDDGFTHVALVNNHLEPEHVAAIERARATLAAERGARCISFPNQLARRWGRTLTDEFKRGDCHAGRYETSLVLAARPDLVQSDVTKTLQAVPISLSAAIDAAAGAPVRFVDIGMDRAYTGAPAEATAAEGETTYDRLVAMIVSELTEHMRAAEDGKTGSGTALEKEEKHR